MREPNKGTQKTYLKLQDKNGKQTGNPENICAINVKERECKTQKDFSALLFETIGI